MMTLDNTLESPEVLSKRGMPLLALEIRFGWLSWDTALAGSKSSTGAARVESHCIR